MQTKVFWLGWAAAVLAASVAAGPGNDMTVQRQPVLVELFTSEGCSSCPPADAVLEKLDRDQPVAGAEIIVLSEHVDYWNHLGWADPYSSPAFSARQVMYARRFGLEGPYTPEMVVDGSAQFVGSDLRKAESAIGGAISDPRVGVRIGASASGAPSVTLEVDPLPAGKVHKANVYVAQAADHGSTDVLRGENRGRTLHYVSIVTEIRQVGSIGRHSGFRTRLPIGAPVSPAGSRLIAFVQEADNGPVRGAAMYAIPAGAQR